MSTYVFVHGAWGGSWCWDRVASMLQEAGHNALAVDLPGRAGDPRPHNLITLNDYVQKVRGVIELQSEQVILAGHSMGGVILSAAAQANPDSIRNLVYVSAFLLEDGESMFDQAATDRDSLVGPYLVVDEKVGSAYLRPEAPLKEICFGSCTEEDVARARALLVPEPLAPLTTPLHITPERFGRVPRDYVECRRDRTISPELQRRMVARSGCRHLFSIDTDHSPFWSAPTLLARHLLDVQ
jgi:pimeloyl-ACP methyl ester carboxylesterase